MRTFTSQAHDSNYGGNQLLLLDKVLREECHYVDRDALGHWCGLNRPWWIPESGYNLDDYLRLLRQLQTNEVPNIALRLAKRTRIDDIGVMGYAMLASPTLEKGLQIASHLVEENYPYLKAWLSVSEEHALLHCEVLPSGQEFFQMLIEEWLVSTWRYIQVLLPDGLAACASYAALNFRAPTYHWQFQQILGCHVDFEQPHAVLAIPKQWLYIAIQGHSDEARTLYENQIRRLLKEREYSNDLVSQVKRLLVQKPGECGYSLERTAPLLSLSPRTLRRHLANLGTSFRQVCLEVRIELAKDYLLNTQLTAQEIAYQLGYSQPNNFYRAFKSVTGSPPERFRESRIL